jgi:hypothetical protein
VSKIKAVVLEKSGHSYTVLAKNGTFRRIHRKLNAEVGEEVEIQTGIEGLQGIRVWASAVALFLLVLTALWGWNLYQAPTAVALLSVDINPRLELSIDSQGHVIKSQAENDDAQRILNKIDLANKPVDDVLEEIISQAVQQKFLHQGQNWVVIGYSSISNQTEKLMPKELNQQQILTLVTQSVENKGLDPKVAVFSLTPKDKESAQQGGLTLGEFALWQTAQKAGVDTKPDQLKDTSERMRLLENSQVQTQMNAEKVETTVPEKGADNKKTDLPKVKGSENSSFNNSEPAQGLKPHQTMGNESADKSKGHEPESNQDNNGSKSRNSDNTSRQKSQQGKGPGTGEVPVFSLNPVHSFDSNDKEALNSEESKQKENGQTGGSDKNKNNH